MSEVLLNSTLAAPLASSTVAADVNLCVNEQGFGQIFNQLTQAFRTQGDSATPATKLIKNIQSLTAPLNLPTELSKAIQALLPESISGDGGDIALDASKTGIQGETEFIVTEATEAQAANQDTPVTSSLETVCQMMESIAAMVAFSSVQPVLNPEAVKLEYNTESGASVENLGVIPELTVQVTTSPMGQSIAQDSSITPNELSPTGSIEIPNSPDFQSQFTLRSSGEETILSGQLNVLTAENLKQSAQQLDVPVTKTDPIAITTIEGEVTETVIPFEQRKFSLINNSTIRSVAKENGRASLGDENQNSANSKGLIIQPQIQASADSSRFASVSGLSGGSGEFALDTESQTVKVDLSILQTGSSLETNRVAELDPTTQMAVSSFDDVLERLTETVTDGLDATPVKKEAVFSQIVEKAKVMATNQSSEMELQLKPESLGKIQLRITLENHLISAKFVAESEQVKALIESNFTDLKQMLNQNGIRVDQLLVSVGQQGSGEQNPAGNPFQGNSHTAFAAKRHFNETAEAEAKSSAPTELTRDRMRIDLIA